MKEINLKTLTTPALILLLIIITFLILRPILTAIVFGLILGYIFHPVYKKIKFLVKEKSISAFLVCLIVLIVFLIPAWFLIPVLVKQIFNVYTFAQSVDLRSFFEGFFPNIFPSQTSTELIVAVNNFVGKSVNLILSGFSDFLLDLPSLMLDVAVALFVFFFTLRDADKLKSYIKELSPFDEQIEKKISSRFKDMTQAVIFGYIIIGIVQGLLTGLGLLIFGVSQTLLLTMLAMFFSILPVVGAWLVWIPASLYLMLTGHVGTGIGLFVYGAVIVSWVDNFIRPYLVFKKTKVHPAIIFIGMVGGLILFGFIGIIVGPLVLSYTLILIEAYKNKNRENS